MIHMIPSPSSYIWSDKKKTYFFDFLLKIVAVI